MTADELRDLARRWVEAGWRRPDAESFRALHAPEFRDRSASGRAEDREGFWRGVVDLYAAFPDFTATIEDLIVDAERGRVAIRWTATGTLRGSFMGIEPRGRRVRFAGIEIIRAVDGLIHERWGEWNGLELLEQLRA